MYDVDAIEAINFEQLVTVTDRLLLRGGRMPKRRPSTNRIGPRLEAIDRTVVIRKPPSAISTTALALGSALTIVALFIATLATLA